MQKQGDAIGERGIKINEKINEFNDFIEENRELTFIDVLNIKGFSVKFIFFAIFSDYHRDIIFYEDKINQIVASFNKQIIDTDIEKYKIEVVLIPTFNGSMDLKNRMEEWDD